MTSSLQKILNKLLHCIHRLKRNNRVRNYEFDIFKLEGYVEAMISHENWVHLEARWKEFVEFFLSVRNKYSARFGCHIIQALKKLLIYSKHSKCNMFNYHSFNWHQQYRIYLKCSFYMLREHTVKPIQCKNSTVFKKKIVRIYNIGVLQCNGNIVCKCNIII